MISIGTSGFSYADWKGHFYPEKMQPKDMLAFYAQHFSACEINSTYYRIPSATTIESMLKKSLGRVRFVVKAHQSMTHQRNANKAAYHAFTDALHPFVQAGCLGAVLLQFPYSFPNDLTNRGYLADIREQLRDINSLVVEFRHKSWVHAAIPAFMKELHLGTVNVDEPKIKGLLKPAEQVTSNVGYVRFHGRNEKDWYKKEAEPWERYNYLYTVNELKSWLERIHVIDQHTDETFVFFNNHWQSQAVINAKQLINLISDTSS